MPRVHGPSQGMCQSCLPRSGGAPQHLRRPPYLKVQNGVLLQPLEKALGDVQDQLAHLAVDLVGIWLLKHTIEDVEQPKLHGRSTHTEGSGTHMGSAAAEPSTQARDAHS